MHRCPGDARALVKSQDIVRDILIEGSLAEAKQKYQHENEPR